MIKYIRSELYRTFKTPMYRNFLIFSLVIVLLSIGLFKPMAGGEELDYLELMYLFAMIAIMIILSISMIIAYKTKDTKVQILSYGITRDEMYFLDLVTNILVTVITTTLLAMLALVTSFVGEKLGLVTVNGSYKDFMIYAGVLLLYSINICFQIYGLSHILNGTALGLAGTFIIIPMASQLLMALSESKLLETFNIIQPYVLMTNNVGMPLNLYTAEIWEHIGMSVVFSIVVYLFGGLIAFKKREIY